MPTTLRTAIASVGALIAVAAGASAALPTPPAITAGCEPGTSIRFKVEFAWPSGVAKPAALQDRSFMCAIQDTAMIDAFTVGSAASPALQDAVMYGNGSLTDPQTAGLEYTHMFTFTHPTDTSGDRVSEDVSIPLKGKVANPVMKCFGGVQPSPDWFFAVDVSDLCSLPTTTATRDIKLYDLGTMQGSTFAASTTPTSPTGTVQPVTAFTQVFGKLSISRKPAGSECRTTGEALTWTPAVVWPTNGGTMPAGAKVTGLVCAVHTTNFSMWRSNELASAALKSLAETGATAMASLPARLMDAGTDSGSTWTAAAAPLSPAQRISPAYPFSGVYMNFGSKLGTGTPAPTPAPESSSTAVVSSMAAAAVLFSALL